MNVAIMFGLHKRGQLIEQMSDYQLFKRDYPMELDITPHSKKKIVQL